MKSLNRLRFMLMRALATLSAELHESMRIRVISWCSGGRCTLHGDGIRM